MRLMVRLIILAIVVTLLAYLGYGIYHKTKQKELAVLKTAFIPEFTFQGLNLENVKKENASGKPLWLVFFDTGCEYCQIEAEDIHKAGSLNDFQIWMVSQERTDSIAAFGNKYGLNSLSHVQLLKDSTHAAYHIFNVTSSPASFLYGANGALIKSYKGVVKVETILQDLKKTKSK